MVRRAQPRPELKRTSVPVFQLYGQAGTVLALAFTVLLAAHRHLSWCVIVAVDAAALVTFLGMAETMSRLMGKARMVCYRQVIGVLIAQAIVLRIFEAPLLKYLDVSALGIGVFLVCGRLGCFSVGCCHGRPSCWGAGYRKEHAQAGFPPYLVGVRLFPIQAVESIFVVRLVAFGTALVLKGFPAGSALAFYVITYAFGRFWIEFARGDTVRPYFGGFSEAQWTSLFLALGVVCAEYRAPVCLVYQARINVTASGEQQSTVGYSPDPDVADFWDVIRQHIERTFSCTFVDPVVGFTIVPDVQVQNVPLGEVTLYDSLFTPTRN
jgi:Prolipoprotein diacylglyceryl transferase